MKRKQPGYRVYREVLGGLPRSDEQGVTRKQMYSKLGSHRLTEEMGVNFALDTLMSMRLAMCSGHAQPDQQVFRRTARGDDIAQSLPPERPRKRIWRRPSKQ